MARQSKGCHLPNRGPLQQMGDRTEHEGYCEEDEACTLPWLWPDHHS